jgi:hypothetical protein
MAFIDSIYLWLLIYEIMTQIFAGTQYTQQSYKVSDSFPFKWINKKWREGFHVTSMATAAHRWGVVMSRNAGFSDQVEFCLWYFQQLLFSLSQNSYFFYEKKKKGIKYHCISLSG